MTPHIPQQPQVMQPKPVEPLDPMLAPVSRITYEIDPLVLERPVKISIRGPNQMVHREAMRQQLPAIAQFLLNPAFMRELAQIGYKPDIMTIARLFQESTGLGRAYPLMSPLTPEEQQMRQQPSPEVQAQQQQAQLNAQVRREAMQIKAQTEQRIAEMELAAKTQIEDEKIKLEILKLIEKEREAQLSKPDPQMQKMELQMKAAEKQIDLQSKIRLSELDLQTQSLKNRAANQQAMQKMQLDSMRGQMQLQQTAAQGALQARIAKMQPNRPPKSTEDSGSRPDSKPK